MLTLEGFSLFESIVILIIAAIIIAYVMSLMLSIRDMIAATARKNNAQADLFEKLAKTLDATISSIEAEENRSQIRPVK